MAAIKENIIQSTSIDFINILLKYEDTHKTIKKISNETLLQCNNIKKYMNFDFPYERLNFH